MYNDIYLTNKRAFRDGVLVGIVATIVTAVVLNRINKPEPPAERPLYQAPQS